MTAEEELHGTLAELWKVIGRLNREKENDMDLQGAIGNIKQARNLLGEANSIINGAQAEVNRLKDENLKLAEVRAQQLPEGVEWPRFEDGELVKIGDEVDGDGETMAAKAVTLFAKGWDMTLEANDAIAVLSGTNGERVKRPSRQVLDADGVPIEVGDVVYLRNNGRRGTVVGIYADECMTLVDYDGMITVRTDGVCLSHKRPDSWERLEEDVYHLVMSEYLETPEEDVKGILRRAKALAKAGE